MIYRKRYWEPKGCCDIDDPSVALMIYDWSITSGKAVREVQKVLVENFGAEITTDNLMGSRTSEAINSVSDQNALVQELASARKSYYESLTFNRDGTRNHNLRFLKGWTNRVDRGLETTR